MNFTDPTGEAIPLLAALALAWLVAETALTASDLLDFFDKLFDPCVNTRDKALLAYWRCWGSSVPVVDMASWLNFWTNLPNSCAGQRG